MKKSAVALFDDVEGRKMIEAACHNHGLNYGDFRELVDLEVQKSGKSRRHGLFLEFDDILDRISDE